MDGHLKSRGQVEFFPNRCIRDWKVGMLCSSGKFQQQHHPHPLRTDTTCKLLMVSKKTKKTVRFCYPIAINNRKTHLKLWKPRSAPSIKENPSCSCGYYDHVPPKPMMSYPQQQQLRNTNNNSRHMADQMNPMYVNRYSYHPLPTTSPWVVKDGNDPSLVFKTNENDNSNNKKIEKTNKSNNNHDDMKSHYATQQDAEQAIRWMKSQGYHGSDILNSYYNVERQFWFVGHNTKKKLDGS